MENAEDYAYPWHNSCHHIAHTLSSDSQLPDRVGELGRLASLGNWVWETASACNPDQEQQRLIPDGRFTLPVAPSTVNDLVRESGGLPLEGGRGLVLLAIRQWVEDFPSAALTDCMENRAEWQEALSNLAAAVPTGVHASHDPGLDPRLFLARSAALARRELSRVGLPATPGTVAHALFRANPLRFPQTAGPTRGILVTSMAVDTFCGGQNIRTIVHGQELAGSYPWTTNELAEKATALTRKHREWIGTETSWGPTPIPSLAGRPKGQGHPDTHLQQDIERLKARETTWKGLLTSAIARLEADNGKKLTERQRRAEYQRVWAASKRATRM